MWSIVQYYALHTTLVTCLIVQKRIEKLLHKIKLKAGGENLGEMQINVPFVFDNGEFKARKSQYL
jgi:hypothetical protein